jgi:galactose oxidase
MRDRFAVSRDAQTQTATFDVASGDVSQLLVDNTNHDMFCPGISATGAGSIVVTGGDNAEKTSIYVPGEGWVPGPDMNIPRGYQASCTLSDGRVSIPGLARTASARAFCTMAHSCCSDRCSWRIWPLRSS